MYTHTLDTSWTLSQTMTCSSIPRCGQGSASLTPSPSHSPLPNTLNLMVTQKLPMRQFYPSWEASNWNIVVVGSLQFPWYKMQSIIPWMPTEDAPPTPLFSDSPPPTKIPLLAQTSLQSDQMVWLKPCRQEYGGRWTTAAWRWPGRPTRRGGCPRSTRLGI